MVNQTHQHQSRSCRKSGTGLSIAVISAIVLAVVAHISLVRAAEPPLFQGIIAQLTEKIADLESQMDKAQADQVHLLSPVVFLKSRKNLDRAKTELEKRKGVDKLAERLNEVEDQLKLALRNASEARKQLPDLIKAREDALAADAPEYALELYDEAEEQFKGAMEEIEDNDINSALKKGKESEDKFRDAELLAIKTSIIGKVHTVLKQADEAKAEKYAPVTLAKAKSLLAESEKILNTNRRAQATARQKAEEAEYEASHAIYLSNLVQEYKADEKNWERLILSYEENVQKVAGELNFNPRFDSGLEKPLNSIRLAITNLKDDNKRLSQNLTELNADVAGKEQEVKRLLGKLDKTESDLREKNAKLEAEKRKEAKLKRIEELFSASEAKVIREGTNLILRLVGLSFPSGKTTIGVEYFSILTKVQQAIREFPECHITIEGHTDSRGRDVSNMRLSNERANSVKTYLQVNMGLPESRIQAVGYGKSKPIATNETEDGRSMNRRIDVLLDLSKTDAVTNK